MENNKQLFKTYYARLRREGILKALIPGLIAGFAVDFCVATVTWFLEWNGLWVSISAGIAAALLMTLFCYFRFFRPTAHKIALRLDKLGLEERVVTMLELQKDESYMAMLQREDAEAKLRETDAKRLKGHYSVAAIAVAAVLAVLGISMTTLNTLSAEGVVPSPPVILDPFFPQPQEVVYSVSYLVEEGGYIEGEAEQLVVEGEDATPVLAVADEGWMFEEWDDGYLDPSRIDTNVRGELVLTARFVSIEETDAPDGEGAGSDAGQEGDEADDRPSENGDESDGEGNGDSQGDESGNQGQGAGGKYEERNQIIDGEHYYRDELEAGYYERAMEMLRNGQDIPPELRAIIEAYFGIIL